MIARQPAQTDACKILFLTLCVFQSLHAKVVHQYQQHYREGPPTSGDEECLYWIRFLTYHMAKANLAQVVALARLKHF